MGFGRERMSTNTSPDQESIAPYERTQHRGQPRWTHPTTGLVATIAKDASPPGRQLAPSTAYDRSDATWIFEVRPDGPNSPAEVYERLSGSQEAAVARARRWLAQHPHGHL